MATDRSWSNLKTDDLRNTCGLCMERFSDDRTPKILSCFHTFCLPCLTSLVQRSSAADSDIGREEEANAKQKLSDCSNSEETDKEEADARPDETHKAPDKIKDASKVEEKKILCPTCRSPTSIPQNEPSGLQTNFYVDFETSSPEDAMSRQQSMCEMCSEGEEQEASHICLTCQQNMCHSCHRLHDMVKGARNHQVMPAATQGALQARRPGGTASKRCWFHPDQSLCFQCCECNTAICLHCKLTLHEGHDTEDMASAALHAKEELAGIQTEGSKQLYLLETCIHRLERDEHDLQHQQQEVIKQVTACYNALTAWAARSRDDVLEMLASKAELSLNKIHSKKAAASILRETISAMLERSLSCLKLSSADIVLMKNELQAALLSDDRMRDYHKLGNRDDILTFFTYNAESSIIDLDTMGRYMGTLRDSEDEESAEMTVLSLRDLTKLVSKLEAKIVSLKDQIQSEKVSFHVVMTSANSYSTNQTVLFNEIKYNHGNCYNAGNGIFTAPEEGTYIFMATVRHVSNGAPAMVFLLVNGAEWGRTEPPDSCTVHAVVKLNEGEQVFVRAAQNFQCRASDCMFSGAMIS